MMGNGRGSIVAILVGIFGPKQLIAVSESGRRADRAWSQTSPFRTNTTSTKICPKSLSQNQSKTVDLNNSTAYHSNQHVPLMIPVDVLPNKQTASRLLRVCVLETANANQKQNGISSFLINRNNPNTARTTHLSQQKHHGRPSDQ